MLRRLAAVVLVGVAVGGCALGQRPTLSSERLAAGAETGDPAMDAVLERLDRAERAGTTAPFTATYDVLRVFGEVTTTASVAADGQRRSVTVGPARIVTVDGESTTCRFEGVAACAPGVDAAAFSDSGITTPELFAGAAGRRLRRDAEATIAPPTARQATYAGQPATCVDVPLAAGTAVYCALESGLLAEYHDGSVHVTMTGYIDGADEQLFSTNEL